MRNAVPIIVLSAISCIGCSEHREGPAPQFYRATLSCPLAAREDVEAATNKIGKTSGLKYAAHPYRRDGLHMLLRLYSEDDERIIVEGFEPHNVERVTYGPGLRLYVSALSWNVERRPALKRVAQVLHTDLLATCTRRN